MATLEYKARKAAEARQRRLDPAKAEAQRAANRRSLAAYLEN